MSQIGRISDRTSKGRWSLRASEVLHSNEVGSHLNICHRVVDLVSVASLTVVCCILFGSRCDTYAFFALHRQVPTSRFFSFRMHSPLQALNVSADSEDVPIRTTSVCLCRYLLHFCRVSTGNELPRSTPSTSPHTSLRFRSQNLTDDGVVQDGLSLRSSRDSSFEDAQTRNKQASGDVIASERLVC